MAAIHSIEMALWYHTCAISSRATPLATEPTSRENRESHEHADRIRETYIQGPADLVVEILSESPSDRDLGIKKNDYERHGVREYWQIDPDNRQIRGYVLGPDGRYIQLAPDADGVYSSTVLSGLRLDPKWLWPGPGQQPDIVAALKANGLA